MWQKSNKVTVIATLFKKTKSSWRGFWFRARVIAEAYGFYLILHLNIEPALFSLLFYYK